MSKQKENQFVDRFEKRIKVLFFIELFFIGYGLLSLVTAREGTWDGIVAVFIGMFIMVPLVLISAFLSIFLIPNIDRCNSLTRTAMLCNWIAVLFLIDNVTN